MPRLITDNDTFYVVAADIEEAREDAGRYLSDPQPSNYIFTDKRAAEEQAWALGKYHQPETDWQIFTVTLTITNGTPAKSEEPQR